MNTRFLPVVCLLALHYCSPGFAVDYDSHLESFAVPNHGELVFHVPVDWEINYVFHDEEEAVPPVVTFFARDEEQRELFQLNISALWDDSFTRNVTDPASIRELVEEVGQDILEYSDQEELVLQQLSGGSGEGYYFNVTDSSARPGEYRHLTQGALAVGDVVLVFSLFTHDGDPELKGKTLQMLRAVVQKLQRDVKFFPINRYSLHL